jgi:predicted metal-dependent HD superfamily phosphohydrolase
MELRTPEQHTADIATATLARLQTIRTDLLLLRTQMHVLAAWAEDNGHDPTTFDNAAQAAAHLAAGAPAAVRDMASRLPLRGLEFGN